MKKAIYKITNKINNKVYIGQSNRPEQRFEEHCYKKEAYKSLINNAIIKYGRDNFIFEIIGWFEDYNEKEKYYIGYYNSISPYGYNIMIGGESPPIGSHKIINMEIAKNIQTDLLNLKIQRKQIIKKYNISYDILRHINEGTSWRDNNLNYPLRPGETDINKDRALLVIKLLKTTTLTQKEIGKIVGWNRSAITMINIGKNHKQDDIEYPIRK